MPPQLETLEVLAMQVPEDFKILRMGEVCARTGYSKTTIYRLEAEGKFPRRVKLGENSSGWFAHEVAEYLASLPRAADVA